MTKDTKGADAASILKEELDEIAAGNGIEVYHAALDETVIVLSCVIGFTCDGPMASDLCSQTGHSSKTPCRFCPTTSIKPTKESILQFLGFQRSSDGFNYNSECRNTVFLETRFKEKIKEALDQLADERDESMDDRIKIVIASLKKDGIKDPYFEKFCERNFEGCKVAPLLDGGLVKF